MKRLPALLCLLAAAIILSCNSSDKTNTSTTTDTTATSADTSKMSMTPASTIDTSAQTMLIVVHRVKDFATWLAAYEAHDSAKLASGIHNYVIGRVVGDTNLILVATKADDVAKAKAFASSPGLKAAMQKSGVIGVPKIEIVTDVWQDTGKIGNLPRTMVEYTVKDWAAWKHAFDSTKSVREASGLIDRVVSHDAADNKKVRLVFASSDTAKVSAFRNSDQLKAIWKAEGVIQPVTRTTFDIVKRY